LVQTVVVVVGAVVEVVPGVVVVDVVGATVTGGDTNAGVVVTVVGGLVIEVVVGGMDVVGIDVGTLGSNGGVGGTSEVTGVTTPSNAPDVGVSGASALGNGNGANASRRSASDLLVSGEWRRCDEERVAILPIRRNRSFAVQLPTSSRRSSSRF
jgi:hypothetical protein